MSITAIYQVLLAPRRGIDSSSIRDPVKDITENDPYHHMAQALRLLDTHFIVVLVSHKGKISAIRAPSKGAIYFEHAVDRMPKNTRSMRSESAIYKRCRYIFVYEELRTIRTCAGMVGLEFDTLHAFDLLYGTEFKLDKQ
jgi:hypothetical protein